MKFRHLKNLKKSVIKKFENISPNAFEHFWNQIMKLLGNYNEYELNSKSAYKIYQQIRDEMRTKEFYKEVVNE